MVREIILPQSVLKLLKLDIERIHTQSQQINILKRYLLISHKKLNLNTRLGLRIGYVLFYLCQFHVIIGL